MPSTGNPDNRHFRDYPLTGHAKIDANDPISDVGIAGHRPTIVLYSHSISPSMGATLSGEHVERRLAAILAADVAGYSRLMAADEVGTLTALKAHPREVVDPAIAAHHGRIVKTTGDGMLVEFASVVDAVTWAMVVQAEMAERNGKATQKIAFRIDINIGEIISDGDDIF